VQPYLLIFPFCDGYSTFRQKPAIVTKSSDVVGACMSHTLSCIMTWPLPKPSPSQARPSQQQRCQGPAGVMKDLSFCIRVLKRSSVDRKRHKSRNRDSVDKLMAPRRSSTTQRHTSKSSRPPASAQRAGILVIR